MLAKESTITCGERVRWRRRCSQRVTKSIDRPALKINARKQRCGDTLLALAQQSPRLFRNLNVPREQDDARWLQPLEQGTEPRRHLRALETNNQDLADRINTAKLTWNLHLFLRIKLPPCTPVSSVVKSLS